MKRIAFILAFTVMAVGLAPLHAQTNTEKILELESAVSAIQNSVDSLDVAVSGLMENFERIASDIDDLDDGMDTLNNGKWSQPALVEQYSRMAMKWVCLLIFAVFLPLLLVRLFNNKAKEDQRRYDIVVDLIRSGLEIKPEMREYLTGISSSDKTLRNGTFSGMSQVDVNYCSKRLLWAVCLLVIGFTIAVTFNEGEVFGIFACVAVIFVAQVVVRYFSIRYFNKHLKIEEKEDAE